MGRSVWIGSEGLPWVSPWGEKEGKEPFYAHRRGELLDNPPFVPLQLPNSWQGFAIAAASGGFPRVSQRERVEHAELILPSSVPAATRGWECTARCEGREHVALILPRRARGWDLGCRREDSSFSWVQAGSFP